MDKQFKDFPFISSENYNPDKDFFVVPGNGTDRPTSLIKVNQGIENFERSDKIKPVQPNNSFAFLGSHGSMSNDSPVMFINSVNPISELSRTTVTTYDLASFGLPSTATAAFIKLYIPAGNPNVDFDYYTNANGDGGHTMDNYEVKTRYYPRGDIHTWSLWVPASNSKIYIKWRNVDARVSGARRFQAWLSCYI